MIFSSRVESQLVRISQILLIIFGEAGVERRFYARRLASDRASGNHRTGTGRDFRQSRHRQNISPGYELT